MYKSYKITFFIFCLNIIFTITPNNQSNKWIVLTTINAPTESMIEQFRQLKLQNWSIVVVADKKTPSGWDIPECIFLSVRKQNELDYNIIKLLPWNHYSRKNIGYLYAIEQGATIIYEADDDNFLLENITTCLFEKNSCLHEKKFCLRFDTNETVVNPYKYFSNENIWPRGYPLDKIKDPLCEKYVFKETYIPIQQALVDNDPDVDAIFRLTGKYSIFFQNKAPIAIPHGTMCPFNTQNTFFHYSAFWGLLLPVKTTFRVADIWRGYWAQRLLWDINAHLIFLPASATQYRNYHDLMRDFSDELPLYLETTKLIDVLNNWNSEKNNLYARILDLFDALVDEKLFEKEERELADAWIKDLINLGYSPPTIFQL